jgi:hypothetical protein
MITMPHHPNIRIVPHSPISHDKTHYEHSAESITWSIFGAIILFLIALIVSRLKND